MNPFQPSAQTRKGKGDAAARGEYGQHPDHDGGGQASANADGLGERPHKMDVRRLAHGHEESVLASIHALSRAAEELPEHEQSGPRVPEVQ